jgi:hypothetical protein
LLMYWWILLLMNSIAAKCSHRQQCHYICITVLWLYNCSLELYPFKSARILIHIYIHNLHLFDLLMHSLHAAANISSNSSSNPLWGDATYSWEVRMMHWYNNLLLTLLCYSLADYCSTFFFGCWIIVFFFFRNGCWIIVILQVFRYGIGRSY